MKVPLRMNASSFKLDSTKIKGGEEGKCHLPVVTHSGPQVLVGSIMLENHYLVFDMTPKEFSDSKYLRVGFTIADGGDMIISNHSRSFM